MSIVSLTVFQNEPFETYVAGSCSCKDSPLTPRGICENSDWHYGNQICCGGIATSQPLCSKLNPSFCPDFGGTGPVSFEWYNPEMNRQGIGLTGVPISCSYHVSQFSSLDDIDKWRELSGSESQLRGVILPYFCAQRVKTCRNNSITGRPMPSCSRFMSTERDGEICRTWKNENPLLADRAMTDYCNTYPNSLDCRCLQRFANPDFNLLSPSISASPACWYRPCQEPESHLVTSDLASQVCSSEVCNEISPFFQKQLKSRIFTEKQLREITTCSPTLRRLQKYSYLSTHFSFPLWITILLVLLLIILISALVFLPVKRK